MKKDIENINDKGEWHGYVELYWVNILELRGNYKNGKEISYEEWHHNKQTNFYIR